MTEFKLVDTFYNLFEPVTTLTIKMSLPSCPNWSRISAEFFSPRYDEDSDTSLILSTFSEAQKCAVSRCPLCILLMAKVSRGIGFLPTKYFNTHRMQVQRARIDPEQSF